MRGLLLALVVIGLVAVAVPAAEAHTDSCWHAEPKCMVECTYGHLKFDPLGDHQCRAIWDP